MPQVLAVIGAVATVVGTVKAASDSRKARKLQGQQQAVATRRSRRQAIREMQIRRAQAVASSVGAGSYGGSGSRGGIGSLGSQLGEQFGYSTQMSGLSGGINRAQAGAEMGQSIAGIGSNLFSFGYNFSPEGSFVRDPFGTQSK